MTSQGKTPRSQILLIIATLAALHTVLSFIPGVWRRGSILMEPIEGIIGGPIPGFAAALLGSFLGRIFKPDAVFFENFFGIGEAFGALSAGLMLKRRWGVVLAIFIALLSFFFISPNSKGIPIWTLWDVYLALLVVIPAAILIKHITGENGSSKYTVSAIILIAFIAVETDVLVRIVMLVPLGLFMIYPIPFDMLPGIFILGAFTTPLEALYTVIAYSAIGTPLLLVLKKYKLLRWPIS